MDLIKMNPNVQYVIAQIVEKNRFRLFFLSNCR